MKSMCKFLGLGLLLTLLATLALAQRPRTASEQDKSARTANPTPAPQGVTVKYEGGVFGYNRKIDGTLSFDDMNKRLLFRNKERKELFSIPYESIVSAFADTQSKRPTAASILGSASIYTFPARFIKKKFRYLTLQYNDPDTHIKGTTSFKMQNKEILESVLNTLANKAELTQRGEVYVRRNNSTAADPQASPE
jgi:hypothetical protein